MIVRIMGEGQFDVADRHFARLDRLDDRLEDAIDRADRDAFAAGLRDLLSAVRELGTPVPEDVVVPSDLILPDADSDLYDLGILLREEGLIPN